MQPSARLEDDPESGTILAHFIELRVLIVGPKFSIERFANHFSHIEFFYWF
jgi:hypothetical protein